MRISIMSKAHAALLAALLCAAAAFAQTTHTVSFDLNGGSGAEPAAASVTSGGTLAATAKPSAAGITRTGYSNDGNWYTRKGATELNYEYTPFVFGASGTGTAVTGNITLYLKWAIDVSAVTVWDGTSDIAWYTGPNAQTYNITTAEELAGLAYLVNEQGINFQGKTIQLREDIFLNDISGSTGANFDAAGKKPWTPIGTYSSYSGWKPFLGEFTGLVGNINRKIYGLYIPNGGEGQGLFGCIASGEGQNSGQIKNLDVLVGTVTGTDYVGGVVGYGGSFTEVNSDIAVTGRNYVGGVAGWASGAMTAVSVSASISGSGNYAGGLAGYVNSGNITRSNYNGGSVHGARYAGGLAGYIDYGNITSSYHTGGNVSGTNGVGGLAGYINGNIVSSYHTGGDVSGTDSVGGLAGKSVSQAVTGVDSDMGYMTFSKGEVTGRNYVGGLIGYAYYNTTRMDSIVNVYSLGGVSGESYVGGLVGYSQGYSEYYSKYIKNAYSKGTVQGSGSYVGGLVGRISNGNIISSNHTGGNVAGLDYVGGLAGYSASRAVTGVDSDSGYTTFSKGDVSGRNYVGGLVGYAYYNTSAADSIVYVYSLGGVSGKSYVGGLVGYSYGYSNSSSYYKYIKNAYSKGIVSGDSVYVGGLVGYMVYGNITSSNHSAGNVQGDSSYTGGLVGYINGNIASSYHAGGGVSGANRVGGLVGHAQGTISASYSVSEVTGRDTVGGLAGYSSSSISGSYSLKPVKARSFVGGLAGYSSGGSITNSHSIGDVEGIFNVGGLTGIRTASDNEYIDSCYSESNVTGDDNVGGLAGSLGQSGSSGGDIRNSYATGSVTGDVVNSSSGNDNLGGLVGYAYSGSILRSYALGNVTGTTQVGGLVGRTAGITITAAYAQGSVTATAYGSISGTGAGGLIGRTVGGYTFSNVYSIGKVLISPTQSSTQYSGGLVGYVESSTGTLTLTNAYFDNETGGQTNGVGYGDNSGSPTGKGTTDMKTQSTFTGWDFTNTWAIDTSSEDNSSEASYPYFKWQAKFLSLAEVTSASLTGITYSGDSLMPAVSAVSLGGTALNSTNYTVTYANNVDAGTAQIIITATGYNGKKIIQFTIAPKAVTPTIDNIGDVEYDDGNPKTPNIVVRVGNQALNPVDYTVTYGNNTAVGASASVSVTLKGNYSGTANKTFTITRKRIDPPRPNAGLVYTGEEQTGVDEGTGYTLSGNTQTDAGSYTASATPTANYQWSSGENTASARSISWSIARAPANLPAAIAGLVYTGAEQTGVYEEATYTLTGHTATNAGDYTASATPDANYQWAGGENTTLARTVPWSIARAAINPPAANAGLVYTGAELRGVEEGAGYTLGGDVTGTEAGDYTATATPTGNYKWNVNVSTTFFSENFEGSAHAFTFANGSSYNAWAAGSATYSGGSKSAYISTNNGTSYGYNNSYVTTVHMYGNVTFPASAEDYTISFDWKGGDETCCDYLMAYLVETSVTPTAGSSLSQTVLWSSSNYSGGHSNWQTASINVPSSNSGTTKRLVFSWYNDGSAGSYAAAVDNISISGPGIETGDAFAAIDIPWSIAASSAKIFLGGGSEDISLSGSGANPKVGDVLTAGIDNGAASFAALWIFGGDTVGRAAAYTVSEDDVGGALTLEIDGARSAKTAPVMKGAAPSAPSSPTIDYATYSGIKLVETANSGYEYGMATGSSGTVKWQRSALFNNLTENTTYYFRQRVAETKGAPASPQSDYRSASTLYRPAYQSAYEASAPEPPEPAAFPAALGKESAPLSGGLAGEFTAGPNPVSKHSGIVNFFRQGKQIAGCELRIYDAGGNVVNKVKISDNSTYNSQARRKVGHWDLRDNKGRPVPEGTYLVRGVLKMPDGKSEKVSVIIGVR